MRRRGAAIAAGLITVGFVLCGIARHALAFCVTLFCSAAM